MHRLAKTYRPPSGAIRRPAWHACEEYQGFPYRDQFPIIGQTYDQLVADLHALPEDVDSYGLIHNDFDDDNFTVDYDNGDITVFDFDDSCYFWFMYHLPCAWEGGTGWAMFLPLTERQEFMKRYMDEVMVGYTRENNLRDEWLGRPQDRDAAPDRARLAAGRCPRPVRLSVEPGDLPLRTRRTS